MFCSSRCNRVVACWYTPVITLYRCDGDGRNVRAISSNMVHDNTPWPLPDGRVLYTRWEYVDRSRTSYHHLWTINADGTGQMAYFRTPDIGHQNAVKRRLAARWYREIMMQYMEPERRLGV